MGAIAAAAAMLGEAAKAGGGAAAMAPAMEAAAAGAGAGAAGAAGAGAGAAGAGLSAADAAALGGTAMGSGAEAAAAGAPLATGAGAAGSTPALSAALAAIQAGNYGDAISYLSDMATEQASSQKMPNMKTSMSGGAPKAPSYAPPPQERQARPVSGEGIASGFQPKKAGPPKFALSARPTSGSTAMQTILAQLMNARRLSGNA